MDYINILKAKDYSQKRGRPPGYKDPKRKYRKDSRTDATEERERGEMGHQEPKKRHALDWGSKDTAKVQQFILNITEEEWERYINQDKVKIKTSIADVMQNTIDVGLPEFREKTYLRDAPMDAKWQSKMQPTEKWDSIMAQSKAGANVKLLQTMLVNHDNYNWSDGVLVDNFKNFFEGNNKIELGAGGVLWNDAKVDDDVIGLNFWLDLEIWTSNHDRKRNYSKMPEDVCEKMINKIKSTPPVKGPVQRQTFRMTSTDWQEIDQKDLYDTKDREQEVYQQHQRYVEDQGGYKGKLHRWSTREGMGNVVLPEEWDKDDPEDWWEGAPDKPAWQQRLELDDTDWYLTITSGWQDTSENVAPQDIGTEREVDHRDTGYVYFIRISYGQGGETDSIFEWGVRVLTDFIDLESFSKLPKPIFYEVFRRALTGHLK